MKCPACNRELTVIKLSSMAVSACSGGCGGLWFDHFALQKVEYSSAQEGETLLNIPKDPNVRVETAKKRACPKCNVPMMQHFFSIKKQVSIDECPKCAGYWLDDGELAAIRNEFSSESEAKSATERYFEDNFGNQMNAIREKEIQELQRSQKVRSLFGILSPSNYIKKP